MLVPTMANTINVSVWDYDTAAKDDRVGTITVRFRDVRQGVGAARKSMAARLDTCCVAPPHPPGAHGEAQEATLVQHLRLP